MLLKRNHYYFYLLFIYFFKFNIDTPLGLACGNPRYTISIVPLLSLGSHINFMGNDGFTAIHHGAIGGNWEAIEVSCSFGVKISVLQANMHRVIIPSS